MPSSARKMRSAPDRTVCPLTRGQLDERDLAACHVLLAIDSLVCCDDYVKAGGFRSIQEKPISGTNPAHVADRPNFMTCQQSLGVDRQVLIQQQEHAASNDCHR